MIGDVLVLLKNRLNSHFRAMTVGASDQLWEDKVVFVEGDLKADQIPFKAEALTILLTNIEQEKELRQGDPYARIAPDGASRKSKPDIALNLSILFVARFKDYALGLHYLSLIIRYFQTYNCLDHLNAPELGDGIDHLVVELLSLSASQQNELWGYLRTGYLPSVAYKVRAVIFKEEDTLPKTAITEHSLLGRPL